MRNELRELLRQVVVASGNGAKAPNLRVGALRILHVAPGAERHASHAFEQPDAKHHRPRPELAERQRLDTLILAYHELHVLLVELSLRVRDQLEGDSVDARIAAVRAGFELGQLLVVALRHVRADLASVFHDEEIRVEQPGARRGDVDAARARVEQQLAHIGKHALGFGEPRQEQPVARATDGPRARRRQLMSLGELARVLREPRCPV